MRYTPVKTMHFLADAEGSLAALAHIAQLPRGLRTQIDQLAQQAHTVRMAVQDYIDDHDTHREALKERTQTCCLK